MVVMLMVCVVTIARCDVTQVPISPWNQVVIVVPCWIGWFVLVVGERRLQEVSVALCWEHKNATCEALQY